MLTNRSAVRLLGRAHLWVGLLLTVLIGSAMPQSVSAHASFIEGTPADGEHLDSSPSEIVLTFSEPVGLVDDGMVLHSQSDPPLALDAVADGQSVRVPIESPLEDGAYILQWRVISADSHPIAGTLSFSIGDVTDLGEIELDAGPPEWVTWANTAAKTMSYGGMLASFGLLAVGWLLTRTDMAQIAKIVRGSALVGAIGLLLEFPLAAIVQRGVMVSSIGDLFDGMRQLDSNTTWSLGAGFALLVAVSLASRGNLRDRDLFLMVCIISTASLMTLLLSGHTRSKSPSWVMLPGDAIHVIAGALWLGGIIILSLGLTGRWKGDAFSTLDRATAIVAGFSRMAIWIAIALIISGLAMGVTILRSWEALFNTNYGTTLMVKIGLVAVTLVLAAINRFVLVPGGVTSLGTLRRIVSGELVLILLVVVATGLLVQQNPVVPYEAPETAAKIFDDSVELDDSHTLDLKITKLPDHSLVIVAVLRDETGAPVQVDAPLELSWFLPSDNLGPISGTYELNPNNGQYMGETSLPRSGDWELEVKVSVDRFTDSRNTVQITVPD